jgi:hypothetical protein
MTIRRAEVFYDRGGSWLSADPLILATFLIARRGINNDPFNPCLAQRKQIIDMPVKFFVATQVAPQARCQSIHRAAGVDVSASGEYRGAQLAHAKSFRAP